MFTTFGAEIVNAEAKLLFMFRNTIALLFLLIFTSAFPQTYNLIDTIGYCKGQVRCIALSPTSKYVAEANSSNYNITIWEADSNKVYKTLNGHKGLINSVAYSADGQRLLSSSADGTVTLWDIKTEKNIRTFGDGKSAIRFAYFGKDDKDIIYGGDNGKITKIHNYWAADAEANDIAGAAERILCGAFSPDLKQFAFASGTLLYIINLADNNRLKVIAGSSAPITQMVWDPNGKKIAVRCSSRMIDVWDIRSQEKKSLLAYSSYKSSTDSTQMVFSPDMQYLISGSIDPLPTVWDYDRMESKYNLFGHTDQVKALAISKDGKIVATGSNDATIRLWYMADAVVLTEDNKKKIEEAKKRRPVDNIDTAANTTTPSNISLSANNIPVLLNDRKINPAKTVNVNSKRVTFYVWDDDQIDGDIVSLNLNGKWILQRYKLVKQKKPITVTLNENGNNYLLLYAHNEGEVSPNTAGVSIFDGYKETKLMLKSDLKSCDAVRMVVKQ
ncbi:MAG: WD40 repeat domain-containing protein [Bacteroidetes bacterium]|nr:WD40 repeat domain-containing protein [Bacteroidota bacterium]